jgi:hypothetical protein
LGVGVGLGVGSGVSVGSGVGDAVAVVVAVGLRVAGSVPPPPPSLSLPEPPLQPARAVAPKRARYRRRNIMSVFNSGYKYLGTLAYYLVCPADRRSFDRDTRP